MISAAETITHYRYSTCDLTAIGLDLHCDIHENHQTANMILRPSGPNLPCTQAKLAWRWQLDDRLLSYAKSGHREEYGVDQDLLKLQLARASKSIYLAICAESRKLEEPIDEKAFNSLKHFNLLKMFFNEWDENLQNQRYFQPEQQFPLMTPAQQAQIHSSHGKSCKCPVSRIATNPSPEIQTAVEL